MTAVLRVDLEALARNIAAVRRRIDGAELMLVVKDDAYGHGLEAVVAQASRGGVEWFGAFDVDSGVRVRRAVGRRARIFAWMATGERDIRLALRHDLDLGVGDSDLLEEVAAVAAEEHVPARIHLKIDTGLHRNGVRPEEWPAFTARAAALTALGCVSVVGVWSHISEASDEDDDAARSLFDDAVRVAREAGLDPSLRHLSASAASFARPEFRYDMVRVGAFCYGIRPAGGPTETSLGIRPVARLEATVTGVDDGAVTIDVGKLEGLPSSLSGRFAVATPAGPRRVLAIDTRTRIEGWPDAAAGDTVVVYGPAETGASSVTDLAESIDTIGEEIALRISPLIPRVYSGE
jgi:alanine racemase